ncbi:MAG: hypothetical protein N2557_05025 [Hydrogenophilus sp.]|nr:hypothetical protein [Hydrogenophilus sp.]
MNEGEAFTRLAPLAVAPEWGLSEGEVERRRRRYGRNEAIAPGWEWPRFPLWYEWAALGGTLAVAGATALLWTVAAGEAAIGWWLVAIAITGATWFGSRQARRRWEDLVTHFPWGVTVRRNGRWGRVHATELVPGDIVFLQAHALVPAEVAFFARSGDFGLAIEGERSKKITGGRALGVVTRIFAASPTAARRTAFAMEESAAISWGLGISIAVFWGVLRGGERPLLAAAEAGTLLLLLSPYWRRVLAEVHWGRLLAKAAAAGFFWRSPQGLSLFTTSQRWKVSPAVWNSNGWRVEALLLPFDTPSCEEEERRWVLRRNGRVVNPLALSGCIRLIQALRLWAATAPPESLLPTPMGQAAMAIAECTAGLTAPPLSDPLEQWRLCDRRRREEWGALGWETTAEDRGRRWQVAVGEVAAIAALTGGIPTQGRWPERLANWGDRWVVGVAERRSGQEKKGDAEGEWKWLGGVVLTVRPAEEREQGVELLAQAGVTVEELAEPDDGKERVKWWTPKGEGEAILDGWNSEESPCADLVVVPKGIAAVAAARVVLPQAIRRLQQGAVGVKWASRFTAAAVAGWWLFAKETANAPLWTVGLAAAVVAGEILAFRACGMISLLAFNNKGAGDGDEQVDHGWK